MPNIMSIAKDFIDQCWHGNFNPHCLPHFLSKNCLHQKTIGKRIGLETFLSDCYDWAASFPDYATDVKSIKVYRNLVVCDVDRTGTHLYRYRSTHKDRKRVLTTSDFFTEIEDIEATGLRYAQPAKLIFSFHKDKISQVIIEEDPHGLIKQLGLRPPQEKGSKMAFDDAKFLFDALNASLKTNLSMRETECLALSFCGFSAKHIGEILKISYRTVESFLQHAYQKLGCYGKQQCLELMYESQLLTLWLDFGKLLLQI